MPRIPKQGSPKRWATHRSLRENDQTTAHKDHKGPVNRPNSTSRTPRGERTGTPGQQHSFPAPHKTPNANPVNRQFR